MYEAFIAIVIGFILAMVVLILGFTLKNKWLKILSIPTLNFSTSFVIFVSHNW